MLTDTQTKLAKAFPSLPFLWDYTLAPMTYFKVGGPAEAFISLSESQDIQQVVAFCRQKDIHYTMLAGASNVIISDQGISGLVLNVANTQVTVDGTTVTAGAGTKTALLVKASVDAGLTGLEYFLGVPGNVGGATFNNAHYLQHLIGDFISGVQVLTPENRLVWLTNQECDFDYDHSRFQTSKEIILAVKFSLSEGTKEVSQQLIKEATLYRAQTQPLGEPSSGCIFQNVPMTPKLAEQFPQFKDRTHIGGGFLIDQAGLKGKRVGDIEVSHKHAAFFVNKGTGTAAQALQLIQEVQTTVREKFGVILQTEIFVLGNQPKLNQ